jgi:hypothetical protein
MLAVESDKADVVEVLFEAKADKDAKGDVSARGGVWLMLGGLRRGTCHPVLC